MSSGSAGLTVRSERRVFEGTQGFYEHDSAACAGPMRFGVFMPKSKVRVPALYFLAGLECSEETFAIKAGAQRIAQELGVAIVTSDTSPRQARFPGDDTSWDFGQGAGYYVDATEAPWSSAYRMETYVTQELRTLVEQQFSVRDDVRGLFGHSMGGHGALSLALRHPALFRSVSAFAPIAAPSKAPWGQKAFTHFFGAAQAHWMEHDTVELLKTRQFATKPLVDQGSGDKFLTEQLRPALLGDAVTLRMHEGYDHGYFFVQTFVEDHLRHHARVLST